MELEQYLRERNAPGTVKRYLREIELFFSSVQTPQTANYNQIMAYLGKLRGKQNNINVSLSAIKRYYDYLMAVGVYIN